MEAYKIQSYLQQVEGVRVLAQILQDAVEANEVHDSFDRYVKYSAVPDEPQNFYADVLHIRFIARLEYVKFVTQGHEFTSAQYAFFKIVGDKEARTNVAVRFISPNIASVDVGDPIQLSGVSGTDDLAVGRVRTAISRDLLGNVIENLESWSH